MLPITIVKGISMIWGRDPGIILMFLASPTLVLGMNITGLARVGGCMFLRSVT